MSFEQSLKGWEERKTTAKRSLDNRLASAVKLRESGNEKFRAGDFQAAKYLYTESLAAEETVESLTNRALVLIKLEKFDEAIIDCTRALFLDRNGNVKAYARRGTAKSGLGDHQGALEDFREAELLEPANKALRREREREEAMLQAEQALGGGTSMEAEEEEEEKSLVIPVAATRKPAKQQLEQQQLHTKVLNDTLQAIEQSVGLPQEMPRSGFGFQNLWRELRGRDALRTELIARRMQEQDYVQCFQQSIEPDLFQEILLALPSKQDLVRVFGWFSHMSSFALAKLMLPSAVRTELVQRSEGELVF